MEKKEDKSFPSFILYSRCFLSFSKDPDSIIKFLGDNNNKDIINKYSSNADREFLSAFGQEREVLFSLFLLFVYKISKKEISKEKTVS